MFIALIQGCDSLAINLDLNSVTHLVSQRLVGKQRSHAQGCVAGQDAEHAIYGGFEPTFTVGLLDEFVGNFKSERIRDHHKNTLYAALKKRFYLLFEKVLLWCDTWQRPARKQPLRSFHDLGPCAAQLRDEPTRVQAFNSYAQFVQDRPPRWLHSVSGCVKVPIELVELKEFITVLSESC